MSDPDTEVVRLTELEVGYEGRAFLPPVSLSISSGEQWALLGPNGAGKTTLLKSMLGLLPRVGGEVEWATDVNVGYVPQRANLDESVPGRVVDIVRQGVDQGWSFMRPFHLREMADAVDAAIRDAGVEAFQREQYAELSEGQKQRVLVARALASNPELLVLDEPTAAMDVTAERDVFELLRSLRDQRDLAVIIVSHQLTVAAQYATHGLLVDKDRRFALCGTMREVAHHPESVSRYGLLLQNARKGAE